MVIKMSPLLEKGWIRSIVSKALFVNETINVLKTHTGEYYGIHDCI